LVYDELLRRKHIDVEQELKMRKARGLIDQQKDIDDFKVIYARGQKFLKDKFNKEILFNSEVLAKQQLQKKSLDDPKYTDFFIAGGISYGEIENSPYEK
jgi:hypothetical protein